MATGQLADRSANTPDLAEWAESDGVTEIDSADYWYAVGFHYANQNDHRSAIDCFCKAVVLDQTDGQAYWLISQQLYNTILKDRAALLASEKLHASKQFLTCEIDIAALETKQPSVEAENPK